MAIAPILKKIQEAGAVSSIIKAYKNARFPLEIEKAEGTLPAFLLALLLKEEPLSQTSLAVVPTEFDAVDLAANLEALGVKASILPWWETIAYRPLVSFASVFGERARVLSEMAWGDAGCVIAPERAFLMPAPPPEYLRSLSLTFKTGEKVNTMDVAEKLAEYGYIRTPKAQAHGEFALRGEVLDVFMPGDDDAYRVLFDFDVIESIKKFNPEDQSGGEKVAALRLRPFKEIIWTDDRIDVLSGNLALFDEFAGGGAAIIEELIAKRAAAGEEMLFPLAFEKPATLLDYVQGGAVYFFDKERLVNAEESLAREYESFYLKAKREREVPRPERVLLNFSALEKEARRGVSFMGLKIFGKDAASCAAPRLSAEADPPRSFFGNINYLKEEFGALMKDGWEITIAAESDVQADRIRSIVESEQDAEGGVPRGGERGIKGGAKGGEKAEQGKRLGMGGPDRRSPASLQVITLPVSSGFALSGCKFMLVQENEIFGRTGYSRRQPPRSLKTARSVAIDTFVDLTPGDYVAHINYGIGLFKGIDRIRALGHERDYIKIEYADEETIFVPIEQVNLVQRYIGNQGEAPRLDNLGSKSWENRKNRVKKAAEDLARKLIDLYSRRKASVGFAFPQDTEWQTMFEASFPFDETEDQLRCVEEIKADMESVAPMDRLVCGDVGYGKTEVAVRACFKAIMAGKQVVFLAPTTVLAEQHFENFKERFSRFPVKVSMLSRFVDRKNTREILKQVGKGEIDLLVGTHRVIQKDVFFKNLGLIVVDEEQRFGVKDKEKLKELKTNVDCLTLSATPIPRTLHMSLLKIRDMSLLATPPRNRLPIETVIDEYNEEMIVDAIRREVKRGGQVFFLHNRIEDLRDVRIHLERLAPEMLIDTAHGQMDAHELEDVMRRFIHGGFHVLVSTTIIENGIDIPNVNTIIIDQADKYGVSQLYQLRGRVGRSDRLAYAYLFYSKNTTPNETAMKRLQAISDFTDLGSGFKIAMKDMEIRGAGNLLGKEQSGDIYSVGFDMYMRLLDEAVRRLEDADYESENETLLDLEYSGFIPDSYIDSAQTKMEFYKKIAAVREKADKDHIIDELFDRFGPLPDEVLSLLSLAEIRIICRELGVSSLREREGLARITFNKVAKLSVDRLIRLLKESGGKVKIDPKQANVVTLTTGAIGLKEKSEFIREKLFALSG
ncbi:MAG: transcription-repair coupling factor [Treponema sp.]|jgi:transcription-repair coupling factor (superfamily II helicase)|nr:transcription-repair coupling factor [Treponema sp.]